LKEKLAMYRVGWLTLCVLAFALPAFARPWSDTEGHTVEGEFVRVVKGKVVINISGHMIQVPFGHLIEDDQEYVREQLEAHGLANQLPARKKPAPSKDETDAKPAESDPAANDPKPGPQRKWTDIAGRSIEASFVGMENGNVVLRYKGKRTPYPFDKFSLADRQYVRTEMTIRGEADKVPPVGSPGNVQPGPTTPQFVQTQPPASTPQNTFPSTPAPVQQPEQPTPQAASPSFPSRAQPQPFTPPEPPPAVANAQPEYQQVMVKVCENCKKVVPSNLTAGDRCPFCGVYFGYDKTNGKTSNWAYFAGSASGVVTLVAVGLGILIRIIRASR
jgi:hypothetical protein